MLAKYSLGIGDRFAHQGEHLLKAFIEAEKKGVEITPVWNKSYREHKMVHSEPSSVYEEADQSVKKLGWKNSFGVDADHINMDNVQPFIECSNFFTIDVSNYIGKGAPEAEIESFVRKTRSIFLDDFQIKGLSIPIELTAEEIRKTARKFLMAMQEAASVYTYIKSKKKEEFAVEISIDEVEAPQTTTEFLLILHMIALNSIPIDTIAPKFAGQFNKGVDFEGNLAAFGYGFNDFLVIMQHCVKLFGMKPGLKLSVHTGSDKFSLYPLINSLIKKHDAGLHVKTAGTTWLEEAIGLAKVGGEGLEFMKSVYEEAYKNYDELVSKYVNVLDVNKHNLPTPEEVREWSSEYFVQSLTHNTEAPLFNRDFRQLMHTSYKIAAEKKGKLESLLKLNSEVIGDLVFNNIYTRHITPLFF